MKMTRQEYMDGKVSHQYYYLSLANAAGITFDDEFIRTVRVALDKGDEHLNSIPLQRWDNMCFLDSRNTSLRDELKKRGDLWSLSTGVCMRKAKAKHLAIQMP